MHGCGFFEFAALFLKKSPLPDLPSGDRRGGDGSICCPDCISTGTSMMNSQKKRMYKMALQTRISASAANQMQSPSCLQESNVEGSAKSGNMSPADEASASGTPTKKAVTFQDPAIKKAVTKRGTRNQSFRNSRVSVLCLQF
jgi:hypothetical protein